MRNLAASASPSSEALRFSPEPMKARRNRLLRVHCLD